jgi:hypothetical protein
MADPVTLETIAKQQAVILEELADIHADLRVLQNLFFKTARDTESLRRIIKENGGA